VAKHLLGLHALGVAPSGEVTLLHVVHKGSRRRAARFFARPSLAPLPMGRDTAQCNAMYMMPMP